MAPGGVFFLLALAFRLRACFSQLMLSVDPEMQAALRSFVLAYETWQVLIRSYLVDDAYRARVQAAMRGKYTSKEEMAAAISTEPSVVEARRAMISAAIECLKDPRGEVVVEILRVVIGGSGV